VFNRDFLVDVYALGLAYRLLATLWWLGTPSAIRTNRCALIAIGVIAGYRLNRALGGVSYILIKRARSGLWLTGRKLAISFARVLEPIILLPCCMEWYRSTGNANALAGKVMKSPIDCGAQAQFFISALVVTHSRVGRCDCCSSFGRLLKRCRSDHRNTDDHFLLLVSLSRLR